MILPLANALFAEPELDIPAEGEAAGRFASLLGVELAVPTPNPTPVAVPTGPRAKAEPAANPPRLAPALPGVAIDAPAASMIDPTSGTRSAQPNAGVQDRAADLLAGISPGAVNDAVTTRADRLDPSLPIVGSGVDGGAPQTGAEVGAQRGPDSAIDSVLRAVVSPLAAAPSVPEKPGLLAPERSRDRGKVQADPVAPVADPSAIRLERSAAIPIRDVPFAAAALTADSRQARSGADLPAAPPLPIAAEESQAAAPLTTSAVPIESNPAAVPPLASELGAMRLQGHTAVPETSSTGTGWAPVARVEEIPGHLEQLAQAGGGSARLRLSPPHLGEIELQVQMRGDAVTVRVVAQDEAARAVLEDSRALLADGLASRALRMERLDVTGGGVDREPGPSGSDESRHTPGDGMPRQSGGDPQEHGAGRPESPFDAASRGPGNLGAQQIAQTANPSLTSERVDLRV